MDEAMGVVARTLSEVILPNLERVQASQMEQIAANDRLEQAIEELRERLDGQFAELRVQLTACRAEVAALHAALRAAQGGTAAPGRLMPVH